MKTTTILRTIALTGAIIAIGQQVSAQGYRLDIKTNKELQTFFKHTGKNRPIISGHRGGMVKGFPENSIETFENTLRYTPAFYEIDPRFTKDSVVVLMHDATLDRTTNGTGKLADYTYAEIQKLRLKDVHGNVTNAKIPTLKEVIEWSKGRTVMNLDKKDLPIEYTAKLLKTFNNHVVMVTVHDAQQAKFYYQDNPDRMMSAFVKTKEAFASYEAAGVPWKNMIAYIGPLNKPENKELYDLLHAKGVMCMISSAPTYDKLENPEERAKHFRDTFNQGADILESDLPIEVAEAIKGLVKKGSAQDKFIKGSN